MPPCPSFSVGRGHLKAMRGVPPACQIADGVGAGFPQGIGSITRHKGERSRGRRVLAGIVIQWRRRFGGIRKKAVMVKKSSRVGGLV